MVSPVVVLLLTAVFAVVTVTAAVVAVRAVREVRKQSVVEVAGPGTALETTPSTGRFEADFVGAGGTSRPRSGWGTTAMAARPVELQPRAIEGRVVVPPTQAQVVRTALGRPGVRLNVLLFGMRHALRAENRDRIVALMRREYRHRRRERLSAGRQAIRMAKPTAAPTTDRLHADLAEPRSMSLSERMMS